jgi:hypothetical protein
MRSGSAGTSSTWCAERSISRLYIALLVASSSAFADDASRQFAAVVCLSEAGGPWSLKTRGTLTRTKSRNETMYSFKGGEHAFDWRFVAGAAGTTVQGPGFLMDRFTPEKKSGERSQSLGASGDIRESSGPDVLVLRVASACPAKASRVRGGPSP